MITKIVYVVVANYESIYLEQAYASIWSLKYHNPDAFVSLVMDDDTKKVYEDKNYQEFMYLVDEIISIPFTNDMDNHTRSRWLKTNLRNLVQGRFLFLDTDTIITANISELEKFNGVIGAVPDGHRPINKYAIFSFVIKWMKKYFSNIEISPIINYYNSGVMIVNDCPTAYSFYDLWHRNWAISSAKGFKYDQLPLFATDNELNGVISPIADIFNYQVSETVKFLYSSKILHFYNGEDAESLHPFFGKSWLEDIRSQKRLSNDMKDQILDCKNMFNLKSNMIGGDNVDIFKSYAIKFLQMNKNNILIYSIVNTSSRVLNYIFRKLK